MKKIKLIQYTEFEIDKYIDVVIEQFSVALAKTGIKNPAVIAENKVIGEFFPGRKPNDKQFVFHIQDADTGTQVGWIWLADRGNSELRVADLHINEVNRGLGYGAASMIVAEQFAIDKGFSTISFNVFDENVVAKTMYERLGYRVVAEENGRSEMHKVLLCA
jgi:ribosomal protein S18 acetylase RimI-like enzyme